MILLLIIMAFNRYPCLVCSLLTILCFCCIPGEALIAQSVKNTVFSLDLVSNDPKVIACDMANVCPSCQTCVLGTCWKATFIELDTSNHICFPCLHTSQLC